MEIANCRRAMRLIVRHHPWGGKHLSQSMVLWWRLNRSKIAADIRIGVRKHAREFAVTREEFVVLERAGVL